jgi:hypothetical protein
MNSRFSFLIDLVLFQAAWFACVLATRSDFPHDLPLVGLILVLGRVIQAKRLRASLPFVCACALIGIFGDAVLVKLGFLRFEPYPDLLGAPLWMVALWLNFGLMLHPLFSWFVKSCPRALIGFSVGGAIAYYSGEKLEVLTLTMGWQSALAVGAEWGIAGIILRFLQVRFANGENKS